jgi:Membrane bound O-acyl transferase family
MVPVGDTALPNRRRAPAPPAIAVNPAQTTAKSSPPPSNAPLSELSAQTSMTQSSLILLSTGPFTFSYVLLSVIPLYLELYCVGADAHAAFTFLSTAVSVTAFATCPYIASTQCPQADVILRLACGTAIMKSLDIYFRRHVPPVLKFPASKSAYAWYLLSELRYESFDISTARIPRPDASATKEYLAHLAIFVFLQCLPQTSIVKAFGVLLAIWLIWNFMNHILKYRDSSPLFGSIYHAENISAFWTETWHNAYTSPVRTLGYRPARKLFGPAAGVLGGFAVMAIFHTWSFVPYVPPEGLFRMGCFFLANGLGCIVDFYLWRKRSTWVRTVVSWVYEIFWAQFTAAKCDIPDGVLAIDFRGLCRR